MYTRIWESEDVDSAFSGPPRARANHPFPCFRRLYVTLFWPGEYENDLDDARRAETPVALFAGASSGRRCRINITTDG